MLRLARDPRAVKMIEHELLALAAAHEAGAPVPAVGERVTVDGRPGVVLERVDGADLLGRLRARPWTLFQVARTLGLLHAGLHDVLAPDALPALRDQLRRRLGSGLVPPEVRAAALARLEELPDGDRLLHGDLHPANVLRTSRGCVVIDWTNGARGDAEADVARTLLLVGGGSVPDDAPALLRALLPVLRRSIVRGYLRAYRRRRPLDGERVARWRRVWAAARLAEDIPEERAYLLREAR